MIIIIKLNFISLFVRHLIFPRNSRYEYNDVIFKLCSKLHDVTLTSYCAVDCTNGTQYNSPVEWNNL